jgi:hypothetical protein
MESVTKNIIIILTLFTLLFAAYYFYTQQAASLNFSQNDAELQKMRAQAEVFKQHGVIIEQVKIDTSLFAALPFNQLRAYTTPVEPQLVGRPNPFLPASPETVNQN